MSDNASISWAERRDRALNELCDLGMGLARKLAAQGEEAETRAETERASDAFDRVSRSVRLTFALQARLEREERRGLAEDVKARRLQVRDAVRAVIRPNSTVSERFDREQELDDRLAFAILAPDFLDRPVDDLIARIRRDLDLEDEGEHMEAAPSPPPLGVVNEVRGAGSRGDLVRELPAKLGEGVEGRGDGSGFHAPLPRSLSSGPPPAEPAGGPPPPVGEDLWASELSPAPS